MLPRLPSRRLSGGNLIKGREVLLEAPGSKGPFSASNMRKPHKNMDMFTIAKKTGRVLVLDRPTSLNSLNLSMIRQIDKYLTMWDKSNEVGTIAIMAHPDSKAFCAGGDVVAIYKAMQQGGDTTSFFREEYVLNHKIAKLSKPLAVFQNGITMGGGVGISVHSNLCFATEKTLFAMPETAIGFFPDVGGSFFLSRLNGSLGKFLGLTGHRLRGADVYFAGIANHYCLTENIDGGLVDACDNLEAHYSSSITALHDLHDEDAAHAKRFSLEPHLETIERCFRFNDMELIVEALAKEEKDKDFATKQLAALRKMSPLSLKVTLEQLRRGVELTLEECFQMEYRMAKRFAAGKGDFAEGVRALLIDKNSKPQWKHAKVEDVPERDVLGFFEPVEDDLVIDPTHPYEYDRWALGNDPTKWRDIDTTIEAPLAVFPVN